MPNPDTILEIIEDYGFDIEEAREIAEYMEDHDIDDVDLGVEIYEN